MKLHRLFCMILPAGDMDDHDHESKIIDPHSHRCKNIVASFGSNLVHRFRSCLLILCCHDDRKQPLSDIAFHNAEGVYLLSADKHHHQQHPRTFSYAELYLGTNGFSHEKLLGSGGFGKVFKAVLPGDDTEVAVKCLAEKGDRFEKSFVAELMAVSSLRHKNLVSLRGWCVHDDNQLLLVYDYMPNRSLDRLLFPRPTTGYSSPLSWDRRMRIVKGLAAALYYLHDQLETQIIHRDVKSSNVMLDSNFNAKLGDFGLARWLDHKLDEEEEETEEEDFRTTKNRTPSPKYSMKLNHQLFKLAETTRVGGTIGYLPPESFKRRKDRAPTTAKSDVYSFGIVVLEVVSRRRAVDLTYSLEDEIILVDWVRKLSDKNNLFEAGGRDTLASSSEVEHLTHIGLLCTLDEPQSRPNMKWVVQALSGTICGKLPPLPSFQSHPLYISLSSDDTKTNTSTFATTSTTTVYYSSPKSIKHTVYVTAENGPNTNNHQPTNLSMVETAQEISYKDIVDATNNFSDSKRVAELDFGSAYHGVLNSNRQHVLIKRLGMKSCPALRMRFSNEVKNLGRLRHRNLVQLRGWCSEQGEMLVVYDYLKNRLLSHMLSFHNNDYHRVLPWHHRYNIVKSLASAILYLHEEWDQQVIHKNITSSAVILDPDMNPRLTCFALAEFLARNEHGHARDNISSPAAHGIFGYMSPEYIESGIATTMTDVYSFGVVVLEVVTGRMAVDFRTPEVLLVKRVHDLEARKKSLEGLADPKLIIMGNHREVLRLMKVGVACINSDPEQRPSMRQITSILDGNDQCFMEQGRKKDKDRAWKRRNAYSLSMINRIQALGIQ